MNVINGLVLRKEDWNLWIIKDKVIYIIHRDDFDHKTWEEIKVGDEVTSLEWHKINIDDIDKCLNTPINHTGKRYFSFDLKNMKKV